MPVTSQDTAAAAARYAAARYADAARYAADAKSELWSDCWSMLQALINA